MKRLSVLVGLAAFLTILLGANPAVAQQQVLPLCPGASGGYVPCSAASPLPIGPGILAYGGSTSASVATTSGTLVSAGAYKRALQVCTLPTSTTNVWLNSAGAAAVVNTGIPVAAGGGCANFGNIGFPIPSAAITAITDSGSAQTVTLAGG